MTDPVAPAPRRLRAVAGHCREITEARWFAVLVFSLILANAAVLGVETYSGPAERWHLALRVVEYGFLAAFTVEILLRAGAHADRPGAFFRDPWNLFDLAVVLSAYLPFFRENGTVLRLLRLARVLRAARFLPQLRIVLVAVARSLPGTVSFLLVGGLLLYLYAMVGWICFSASDPEHFGSLGRAVLTLFLLMTLDGLGDAVRAGLEISRWSILYYASYVLLASFVLVNVLIGVVITSLDEARSLEDPPEPGSPAQAAVPLTGDPAVLRDRLAAARRALDDLERALAAAPVEPAVTAPAPEPVAVRADPGHPR
ncbi:voltage-gated sodium channel [Streptomyces sp. Tue 6075]|uniref:ion transporter n=1 Tax=Streptomyces sp. Tue 6075 TaxID=1661694 RepID=UPI00094A61BF|nr:ion transporter [Streptomyces sp. Tue 6075]APS23024.1 voltage-gated sodium channel [Streptomyces sp. Tue 6075]